MEYEIPVLQKSTGTRRRKRPWT